MYCISGGPILTKANPNVPLSGSSNVMFLSLLDSTIIVQWIISKNKLPRRVVKGLAVHSSANQRRLAVELSAVIGGGTDPSFCSHICCT
jgi:hypothetical protein